MGLFFYIVSKLELKIANSEHFKIINNKSVTIAIGTHLYSINLLSGKKNLIQDFDRDIQELIFTEPNELIIFMGKKSKRLSLPDETLLEDGEFEKYRISPITSTQGSVFVRLEDEVNPDIRYRGLYCITENRLLWKSEILNNPIVISGYIFSNSFTKIERFDLATGELLWSQPISEVGRYFQGNLNNGRKIIEGEVHRFLGVYKEVLWVLLKNGLLIGMDIGTGLIVYEIKEPVEYPETYQLIDSRGLNFYYAEPCMLDAVNGQIIGLVQSNRLGSPAYYYEVDLKSSSPQLRIIQLPDDNFENFYMEGGAVGYLWPFDDDYMYVCNYREYKIALFNRKTKKIDWVHQMEMYPLKKSFIVKMEVQGNRWYILDNSKTLYVYEREL